MEQKKTLYKKDLEQCFSMTEADVEHKIEAFNQYLRYNLDMTDIEVAEEGFRKRCRFLAPVDRKVWMICCGMAFGYFMALEDIRRENQQKIEQLFNKEA